MNMIAVLLASIVPLVCGFIWYHPKVFGKTWMMLSGLSEEKLRASNMLLIFGLTYLFSFMIAMTMQMFVVHQVHVASMLMGQPFTDPNTEVGALYKTLMEKFGGNFKTFKHGALHGFMTALFLILPVIGINALFERKNWKYVALHTGYWLICITIMGGIICSMAK